MVIKPNSKIPSHKILKPNERYLNICANVEDVSDKMSGKGHLILTDQRLIFISKLFYFSDYSVVDAFNLENVVKIEPYENKKILNIYKREKLIRITFFTGMVKDFKYVDDKFVDQAIIALNKRKIEMANEDNNKSNTIEKERSKVKCKYCGQLNPPENVKCHFCGAPLE